MHTANLEEGLVVLVAGDAATIVRCVPGSKVEITRYKDKKKIGELSVKQVAALASTSCPRIYQLVKNYDGEIGPHSLLRRKRWLH